MVASSLTDLKELALHLLADVSDGPSLDGLTTALIDLGVKVSVTSLDPRAIQRAMENVLDAGATPEQIQEVITLVSGLGVHSLMTSARPLLEAAARRGLIDRGSPLTPDHQDLWDTHVGSDKYWRSFEREVPGFLEALLRLSPETFAAFFDYCAVPWKTGAVPPLTKELVALATDSTPTHRFAPGLRLHIRNAIKLGAGKAAILQALDIAASAPPHVGVD